MANTKTKGRTVFAKPRKRLTKAMRAELAQYAAHYLGERGVAGVWYELAVAIRTALNEIEISRSGPLIRLDSLRCTKTSTCCSSRRDGFMCTRARGHRGMHAAHAGPNLREARAVAVWEGE